MIARTGANVEHTARDHGIRTPLKSVRPVVDWSTTPRVSPCLPPAGTIRPIAECSQRDRHRGLLELGL
jgi:hypothetical protein